MTRLCATSTGHAENNSLATWPHVGFQTTHHGCKPPWVAVQTGGKPTTVLYMMLFVEHEYHFVAQDSWVICEWSLLRNVTGSMEKYSTAERQAKATQLLRRGQQLRFSEVYKLLPLKRSVQDREYLKTHTCTNCMCCSYTQRHSAVCFCSIFFLCYQSRNTIIGHGNIFYLSSVKHKRVP